MWNISGLDPRSRPRKQVPERPSPFLTTGRHAHDFKILTELGEHLSARSAGAGRGGGACEDNQPPKISRACCHRRPHSHPLRALGEAQRNVLDVAPGKNPPVSRLQRRANRKARIGSMGVIAGSRRRFYQRCPIHRGLGVSAPMRRNATAPCCGNLLVAFFRQFPSLEAWQAKLGIFQAS